MKLKSVKQRLDEIRSSSPYKEWRKKILARDKKCVLCGSIKKLEVDHIKSLALYPHFGLDLENGRVLCYQCHKKTDTYGSFSKFKSNSEIHPVLKGDLFYKLISLPLSINPRGKDIGLSITYLPDKKQWRAGYRFAKTNLTSLEYELEEAVDSLFDKLSYISKYK